MTDANPKDSKALRLAEATERLMSSPTMTVEDWGALNGVHRNTAFKEAAAGRIEGAYRVGNQIRIPSAPWRIKLGLAPSTPRAAALEAA